MFNATHDLPPPYVERTLTFVDNDGRHVVVAEDALASQRQPFVVLGDPGMGKTRLLERLGRQQGFHYLTAAQFRRMQVDALPSCTLVLDALDEVAARNAVDPLEAILDKLGALGSPPFVLGCRAADWHGSNRSASVASDYRAGVRTFTLQGLTASDSHAMLEASFGSDRARAVHDELDAHKLTELMANPQSLIMLCEVAGERVPSGRADLFDRAARKMIAEHNKAHIQSLLNRSPPDALLDAAGAAMAILILGAREGLFTGLQCDTPETHIAVAQISLLPLYGAGPAVLQSRLFRATGDDDCFKDCHRTMAEYLAARWLARVIGQAGNPARVSARLLAIICPDGHVPASLRGLHAWLGYHCEWSRGAVIGADPFGVLNQAEFGRLDADGASYVWRCLKEHSSDNPWFRGNEWRRSFPNPTLVWPCLTGELAAMLQPGNAGHHLRSLVLDVVSLSEHAALLADDLLLLVRKPDAELAERRAAMDIFAGLSGFNWASILQGIAHSAKRDCVRLVDDAIASIGLEEFTDREIAEIVFAQCGGYLLPDTRVGSISYDDFLNLAAITPAERCRGILDAIVTRFESADDARSRARGNDGFGDLVQTLILRQTGLDAHDPRQILRWLAAFAEQHELDHDLRARFAKWLVANDQVRCSVQEHALLSNEGAAALERLHGNIRALSPGLICNENDAVALLETMTHRGLYDAPAYAAFSGIVHGFHLEDGCTGQVLAAARRYAGDRPDLLEILDPPRRHLVRPKALRDLEARRNTAEKALAARKKLECEKMLAEIAAVREGEGVAGPMARCLLAAGSRGDRSLPPEARLAAWYGSELAEAALEGFDAVLDLPALLDPSDAAALLQESDAYHSQLWTITAGVAWRYYRNRTLDGIEPRHLMVALVTRSLKLPLQDKYLDAWAMRALEILERDHELYETYLRSLIQPQFVAGEEHITGMHLLLGGSGDTAVRIRLVAEWFNALTIRRHTYFEALAQLFLDAPGPLHGMATERIDALIALAPPHWTGKLRAEYWASVLLIRDFEGNRETIGAALRDADTIWALKRACRHDRYSQSTMRKLSLSCLVWIYERFAPLWPYSEAPTGMISGWENPWDASGFIQAVIFSIAEYKDRAAVRALHDLVENANTTYGEILRAARSRQRASITETSFRPLEPEMLGAVLSDAAPRSARDVRTVVLDALEGLQARLAGSYTDTVDLFYEAGMPKGEEKCRDTLLDLIAPSLPFGITCAPEPRMPRKRRADIGFSHGRHRLPLEAKLAANRELWTAAEAQLDRLYASADHLAKGEGIYLVFWFGAHCPAPHKGGTRQPAARSPAELKARLEQVLPHGSAARLSVFVLDLTRTLSSNYKPVRVK